MLQSEPPQAGLATWAGKARDENSQVGHQWAQDSSPSSPVPLGFLSSLYHKVSGVLCLLNRKREREREEYPGGLAVKGSSTVSVAAQVTTVVQVLSPAKEFPHASGVTKKKKREREMIILFPLC